MEISVVSHTWLGLDWVVVAALATGLGALFAAVAAGVAYRNLTNLQSQVELMELARKDALRPVVVMTFTEVTDAVSDGPGELVLRGHHLRWVMHNVGPGPALGVKVDAWYIETLPLISGSHEVDWSGLGMHHFHATVPLLRAGEASMDFQWIINHNASPDDVADGFLVWRSYPWGVYGRVEPFGTPNEVHLPRAH